MKLTRHYGKGSTVSGSSFGMLVAHPTQRLHDADTGVEVQREKRRHTKCGTTAGPTSASASENIQVGKNSWWAQAGAD